jgi:hypothetical protein
MSKLAKALTAAAGNAGESLYVEDVFSTYLYTGNGSTQTITNGIDLDGEGGLVWIKRRDSSGDNIVFDSAQSAFVRFLITNSVTSGASSTPPNWITASATGFDIDPNWGTALNGTGQDMASWTFRKAEKFFDVQTFTTTGTGGTQILTHNLGVVPAFILLKRTSSAGNWWAIHSSVTQYSSNWWQNTGVLEGTGAFFQGDLLPSEPTDTEIALGATFTNAGNEGTYVAYLFASDAGGFGDDGSESIIKCGSYTGTGVAGLEVDLGFEPQWILWKNASQGSNWNLYDNMRSMSVSENQATLYANRDLAELTYAQFPFPTATGFIVNEGGAPVNASGDTHIYIAIRRPMKTPESGTEVFSVSDSMSGAVQPAFDAPHVVDMAFQRRPAFTQTTHIASRLTGTNNLYTDTTAAEVSQVENVWDFMYGWGGWSVTNTDYRAWNFKRATGFFDVVAYSAVGSSLTTNHNLGVAPEAVIVKKRSGSANWTWSSNFGGTLVQMELNLNSASSPTNGYINSVTSTTFTTGGSGAVISTGDYIAYLFATLAGVSKVGSYTGTGADLNVDCGFSAGARFILIKRTDDTGDWYYWDSERGIVAGNDPYLLLNTTAAQVTGTDYVDPLSSGFTVTSSAPAALNASGGTYIFLAIA